MEITKIAEIEADNWDKVHWFKSGIFWRAYNVSAYQTIEELRAFKVISKYFKQAKWDAVFVGFPDSVCQELLKGLSEKGLALELKEKDHIILRADEKISVQVFLEWRSQIKKTQDSAQQNGNIALEGNVILKEIKNFPLAIRSPLECQQFLWKIQKELDGAL